MFYKYILIFIIISVVVYFWYIPQYEHMRNKRDEYRDFYNQLNSKAIDNSDKCRLCKIKIKDKEDGINVHDSVLQSAKDYLANNCNKKKPPKPLKPKLDVRNDIDPKKRDSLDATYRNYCLPKFGEIRDRISFDKYLIETDEYGNYMLNGTIINKVQIDLENCRRLEEYILNQENSTTEKPLNINTLYEQCLVNYNELGQCKKGGYNYYLSRDGKYYLNNEPLDRVKLSRSNCEFIKDIKKNTKNSSIKNKENLDLKLMDNKQLEKLCKKSIDYDYICRMYDTNKVIENGKANDKQLEIYQYSTGPDETIDFEYSFLTPGEFDRVNKNIHYGKSGLTADNEIDLCYRKIMLDRECKAMGARK